MEIFSFAIALNRNRVKGRKKKKVSNGGSEKKFMRQNANGFEKISLKNESSHHVIWIWMMGKARGIRKIPLKTLVYVNYATVLLKCIKLAVCGAFMLFEKQ